MGKRLFNIASFIFINPILFIPFPLIRGRGIMVSEGADAPSGFPTTTKRGNLDV